MLTPYLSRALRSYADQFGQPSIAVGLIVGLLASLASLAYGANGTWTPTGGGDWNVNGNWSGATFPNGISQIATLGSSITGNANLELDTNITLGGLNFDDNNNYTITQSTGTTITFDVSSGNASLNVTSVNGSGTHAISNTRIALNDSLNLSVGSGQNFTINARIDGGGGLVKSGAGTLTLTGSVGGNSGYTGGTTISGGTLSVNSAARLGNPSGTVLVTFTGHGTLEVTGNLTTSDEFTSIGGSRSMTLDIDSGVTLTANGNIRAYSGAGSVTKSGLGTLVIGANNTQLDTDILLTGGTIDVRNAGGIGNTAGGDYIIASGGTTTRLTFNAATTVTGSYEVNGTMANLVVDRVAGGAGVTNSLTNLIIDGAYTLNVSAGSNVTSGTAGVTFSGTTTLNGNAVIDVADPAGSPSMRLTLGNVTGTNRNLTIQGTGDTTIGGNITTGSGTLTKLGAGTLILSGNNNYTGLTNVDQGTLSITTATALGTTGGQPPLWATMGRRARL